MWGGSLDLRTPMLWTLGFFPSIGGLTGIVLANCGIDVCAWYLLCCGSFPLRAINGNSILNFGGYYYWIGK